MFQENNVTHVDGPASKMYGRWSLFLGGAGLILVLILMLDSAPYKNEDLDFNVNNTVRSGSLILPTNTQSPRALMIFVHGDGAMGRSAFGYYYPLWQRLAKQGIASYSWDKAGVGGSGGNWLEQNMQNRADEIHQAVAKLRKVPHLAGVPIGLIGFSQAGWVMPKALKNSSQLSFAVFVSTPINWLKQSAFLTQTRLQKEGVTTREKNQQLAQARQVSQLISQGDDHNAYIEFLSTAHPDGIESAMSPERYGFVQKNIGADALEDLQSVKQPLFVAFGNHDSNVNVADNVTQYQQIFASNETQLKLKVYKNANHTLLKNSEFGHLSPSLWWLIKLSLWEEDGFSEQFVDDVMLWLNSQIQQLALKKPESIGAHE
ncbi:hypothetical protein PSECIP111854_00330 [Pseudoalteromonas sp. CIP111854]|uniref:Serine aminopeptidase S33 domain-containing protein n=1 Tax=Pseudoalteromonas holothuriae TaxID=2963714 RepID=A0A9W4QR74_9GAMM|nr:lysophospholipase [Pseudoalteromonas sp. CIP111854]CAH9049683.1 hypothetical protein PSECIP111854_00330 [Pseudoalteromonas sp. CIP111854]